jgi:hypothetical protein
MPSTIFIAFWRVAEANPGSNADESMIRVTSEKRARSRVAVFLTVEADREINALSVGERAQLAFAWHERAAHELSARDGFSRVVAAFHELSVDAALTALAENARDDELRHAELCHAVAECFAGHELPLPAATPIALPDFPAATSRLTAALHVLAHALVSESFATSVLECSLRFATGKLARSALVELLSDELDHAPIGWTYLAGTSDAERRSIEPYLHALVASQLKRARIALGNTRGLVAHGVPAHAVVERALFGSVRESMLPGFSRFGMPAHEIWTWLRRGASTRAEALAAVANFPRSVCLTEWDASLELRSLR